MLVLSWEGEKERDTLNAQFGERGDKIIRVISGFSCELEFQCSLFLVSSLTSRGFILIYYLDCRYCLSYSTCTWYNETSKVLVFLKYPKSHPNPPSSRLFHFCLKQSEDNDPDVMSSREDHNAHTQYLPLILAPQNVELMIRIIVLFGCLPS